MLKSSIPREIIEYNDVLERVENIIAKQEEKYKNKCASGGTTTKEINQVVNECLLKVEEMENELKEVKEALRC